MTTKTDYENWNVLDKYDSSDLIHQSTSRFKTISLFKETSDKSIDDSKPIYTLGKQDQGDLPSAYKIFMASVDEYDAAIRLVGDYSHWRQLTNLKWFLTGGFYFDGLSMWRDDMMLRDYSIAKRAIYKQAMGGSAVAARKLMEISGKEEEIRQRKLKAKHKAVAAKRKKESNVSSILERLQNDG